jgi:hypothetical protein
MKEMKQPNRVYVRLEEDSVLWKYPFFPLDLWIQGNPNENASMLFCRYQWINSKVCMQWKKNPEEPKQSLMSVDLKTYYKDMGTKTVRYW